MRQILCVGEPRTRKPLPFLFTSTVSCSLDSKLADVQLPIHADDVVVPVYRGSCPQVGALFWHREIRAQF